jgi:hypothetical protein
MTLVSSIITQAYRESNLIAVGTTPTANHIAEALDRLNSIVMSTIGNEVGDPLIDVTVGGTYDESEVLSPWVPKNTRLLLNLTAAETYYLHPNPKNGQRFALADIDNNLSTYNVIINGNGRSIEAAATLTLATNGLARQWMYRGDTGNWVRVATLTSSDQLPFPEDFDDYFITMLALRINPRISQQMSAESLKALSRSRSQLNARYNVPYEIEPDLNMRNSLSQKRRTNTTGDDFNTGRVYPYR